MKFNKVKLISVLKQKTTWLGIAALLVASFGFESFSAEQIATAIAGVVAVAFPENPKS